MSSDLFLGLDVGTQGTKALVVDVDARAVVARASSTYDLIPGLPPGAAEQHPDTWWSAVRACTASLAREVELGRVRAIGVSGQQHGFVALDARKQDPPREAVVRHEHRGRGARAHAGPRPPRPGRLHGLEDPVAEAPRARALRAPRARPAAARLDRLEADGRARDGGR